MVSDDEEKVVKAMRTESGGRLGTHRILFAKSPLSHPSEPSRGDRERALSVSVRSISAYP